MTKSKTANKNGNLSSKKVFDVSMPGSVVPSKSSRPIITNNHTIQNDPMFSEVNKTGEYGSYLNDSSARKEIEPISTETLENEQKNTQVKEIKPQEEIIEKAIDPESKETAVIDAPAALVQVQNNISEEKNVKVPEQQNNPSSIKQDVAQDDAAEDANEASNLADAKNNKNLEDAEEKKRLEEAAQLIISKEYNVKISPPKSHRFTKIFICLILILSAAAIVAYIIYSQSI